MLADLRVISGAEFVEEGRVRFRRTENKRLVCFLVDAWRGRLKSVVCPSLLIVMLKVLCFANSVPSRGSFGLFMVGEYDSDVGASVKDGDFDDDSAHRPPTRATLATGRYIVSRYGNRGSQIGEKVVRRHTTCCDRIE